MNMKFAVAGLVVAFACAPASWAKTTHNTIGPKAGGYEFYTGKISDSPGTVVHVDATVGGAAPQHYDISVEYDFAKNTVTIKDPLPAPLHLVSVRQPTAGDKTYVIFANTTGPQVVVTTKEVTKSKK